ncbi:GNAT family N-acetyltransferase [Mariniflexile ostreae]|uniref:GNAT family N-acetyltransferase n=1 Tax=Mariniflexile ostreae TaxID=1520892 RepID=A0ABV5FDT0_9FLAO
MTLKNPFASETFAQIWESHFNKGKRAQTFGFIKGLSFFKSNRLSIYTNVGKNLTKGMSYALVENEMPQDFKNKTALIYDVPQYFEVNTQALPEGIKFKKIKQYPGFLVHQKNYTDFNDYLKKTFSKSSLQKLNRYQRRLEMCFDIKEKMLIGAIDKAEYDFVFDHFNQLLIKRFQDKRITNNNLNPDEWAFYKAVAYPLLVERKAALHVLYNEDTPISVRLLYFSETIVFDAITVFDIDYSKFHIGKVSIMKALEWSFKNKYSIFDFSKGYFDYKASWSDLKYDFEYHVYYDSKSLSAALKANAITALFQFKQYLRAKNIHEKLHKATYSLQKKEISPKGAVLVVAPETIVYKKEDLTAINLSAPYAFLKKELFDFAFLSSTHIKNIHIFKINNQPKDCFLFKTTKQCLVLEVQN